MESQTKREMSTKKFILLLWGKPLTRSGVELIFSIRDFTQGGFGHDTNDFEKYL